MVTKELLGRLDETKKKAQRTVDPRRVQSMQGVAVEDGRRNLRDVRIQSRMEAKRLLTEITSQTDFELEELSDLRAMFQGAVGKTGELTRQQFQDVMAHHRSFRATPAAVLGALFDSFDGTVVSYRMALLDLACGRVTELLRVPCTVQGTTPA